MPVLLPQPTGPQIDPRTGVLTEEWRRYYQALEDSILETGAPSDAQYYVATANANLTNERNLGSLSDGFLKIAVAAGVAVPSTVPGIVPGDFSGIWPVDQGGTGSDLSATGGASQVLQQASPGADVTVGQLTVDDILLVEYGRHTPAISAATNSTTFFPDASMYTRIGDTVHVSGGIQLSVTALGVVSFSMTLPFASSMTEADLTGMGQVDDGGATTNMDLARVTTDSFYTKANTRWKSTMTGAVLLRYAYTYVVV